MTLRKIRISAVAVVLFTLFIASNPAQSTGRDAAVGNATSATIVYATATADWTFSGCWTQFSSQPCRDIFVDQQGQHWICKACGTTGKPGPGKCNPISQTTLNNGLWCS